MSVEIIAIGGYEEVGKNMSAVKVGEDVIIFDMGINLDRVNIHEDTGIARMHSLDLIEGVIQMTPDEEVDSKVRTIVFTHGHLDHIGAVAKQPPIRTTVGTPYLALVENSIKQERKFEVTNPLQVLNAGEKMQISPDITLEFVHTTHSIPQTVHAVLHTSEGIIVYALDFKFDNHMMLSPPPDYQRLRELGNQGVLALIVETTRMTDQHQEKTHSEKVTRIVLEDIMRDMLPSKEGLLVTTFSSHIERIQAICNIAKESNRKIMF